MTGRPRFLYVAPSDDGWRSDGKGRRYFHGGDRYRGLAEEVLSPHGAVERYEWAVDDPVERRAEAIDAVIGDVDAVIGDVDAVIGDVDAVVASPWTWLGEVRGFDAARRQRASRLKVVAGTFDFRLGWIDLDEADRRGVTVVDTSRTMTWTVAEFAVAITLALLRDIPAELDAVRNGHWPDSGRTGRPYVFRDLADCRIGLAGYGSINRHYRRLVEPFGCPVSVFDPFVADDAVAADAVNRTGSLTELAKGSDILVVAILPRRRPWG